MMRFAAFPLFLTLMVPLVAQVPDDQAPVIKVDVDVVNVLCSVRDKHGAYIANLTKDDFTIFEDGKPQTVRYFNREKDLALTIGLLVDVSRSQENLIGVERQAATQFFASVLGKKDMAFLISFGAEAELLQDYTNSHRLLRDALDKLRVNAPVTGIQPGPVPTISKPRGTVLFDAVYLATTDRLKGEVGRKAVVLITDGVDQGSRLTLQDAMAAAQKADAVVYEEKDPAFFLGLSETSSKRFIIIAAGNGTQSEAWLIPASSLWMDCVAYTTECLGRARFLPMAW